MSNLANFSGKEIIKKLENQFGFEKVGQKGSHVKLRKKIDGSMVTVIVPRHSELAVGTLRNIIRQAEMTVEEFLQK